MYCADFQFGTPIYDDSVRLRDEVLRQPLGLSFAPKDLAQEWDKIHFGCFTDGGFLVATLILVALDDETVKMRQVAVDPHYQKKGIGTFLVKESERLARSKGFKKMTLHAREEAVPFYEKLKYRRVGKRFEEVGIPHFKMECELVR